MSSSLSIDSRIGDDCLTALTTRVRDGLWLDREALVEAINEAIEQWCDETPNGYDEDADRRLDRAIEDIFDAAARLTAAGIWWDTADASSPGWAYRWGASDGSTDSGAITGLEEEGEAARLVDLILYAAIPGAPEDESRWVPHDGGECGWDLDIE